MPSFSAKLLLFSLLISLRQIDCLPRVSISSENTEQDESKTATQPDISVDITVLSENTTDQHLDLLGGRPLLKKMQSLFVEAKERVNELKSKAACLQNRTATAQVDISQSLAHTGSCSSQSVQNTKRSISIVITDLEKSIQHLGETVMKFTKDMFKCLRVPEKISCAKKAISTGEKAVGQFGTDIKASMKKGSETWRSLEVALQTCVRDGSQKVSVIEVAFNRQIRQCLS